MRGEVPRCGGQARGSRDARRCRAVPARSSATRGARRPLIRRPRSRAASRTTISNSSRATPTDTQKKRSHRRWQATARRVPSRPHAPERRPNSNNFLYVNKYLAPSRTALGHSHTAASASSRRRAAGLWNAYPPARRRSNSWHQRSVVVTVAEFSRRALRRPRNRTVAGAAWRAPRPSATRR